MSFDLDRLLKIRRFTTLKRLQALEVMFEASVSLGLDALSKEVVSATRFELEVLHLEERYKPRDRRRHGDLAPALEALISHRFRSLAELLNAHRALHAEDSLEGTAASLLLEALLPRGIAPTVNRSFADAQHLIGRRLVRLREDATFREAVSLLGLERVFESFEDLNRRFGGEIGSHAAKAVNRAELRARQKRGHDRFSRIIFRAIGLFPGEDPSDTRKRDALLDGVYRESAALAEEARNRRARRRRAKESSG